MKVVILSQNDPLYTHYFFKRFVKEFEDQFELQAVYLLAPMKDSVSDLIKRTWQFYGPVGFVRMGFTYVLIKLLEKLGRPVSPKNLLDKYKIPVESIASVNTDAFFARMQEHSPDIIVSVSCPQIFKQRLLELPKVAALNIHSGKLPAYKGLFPNFWQMLHGEPTSTVTIHEMVAKVDEGRIVKEITVPIKQGMTLTDLIKQTKEAAVDGLIDVINGYKAQKVKTFTNTDIKPGYYRFPDAKAVREFKSKGLKI